MREGSKKRRNAQMQTLAREIMQEGTAETDYAVCRGASFRTY